MSKEYDIKKGFTIFNSFDEPAGRVRLIDGHPVLEQALYVRRDIKDRLFKFLFGNPAHKKWALELYNALEGKNYTNPEDLEFYTLENALYMHMRNDAAVLVGDWSLMLWEHQSTPAPNITIRLLLYIARVYSRWLSMKKQNLFSSRSIEIPVPRFYILYNGEDRFEGILKLSDHFHIKQDDPMPELKAAVINIRGCQRDEGLGTCRPLFEYEWFIENIRAYSQKMSSYDAVIRTLDEMPEDFEIRSCLLVNREEVVEMSLYEYDEEQHLRMEREYAFDDGLAQGLLQGMQEARSAMIRRTMEVRDMTFEEACELLILTPEEVQEISPYFIGHTDI